MGVEGLITGAVGRGDPPRSANRARLRISRAHPSPAVPGYGNATRARLIPRVPRQPVRAIPTATRARLTRQAPLPPARAMPTTTRAWLTRAAGAAAGAGYANNNQSLAHPGAAGAAAGAGYANNHSGINGTWNGNNYAGWGAAGYGSGYGGGVGAWGAGSPMYGWGYSGYSNPYSAGYSGSGGGSQTVAQQQPGDAPQGSAATAYNYSQPISTTAPPPEQAVAGQANAAFDQARDAFKAGDYAKALQLDQQALAQTPNDRTLHEFLALVFFAQGKYDQAAEPLYAVLSVAPGWDWTTLSGMYPDVDTYTRQLRALEANVKANPESAHARFVLAYQYLSQGHDRGRRRPAQGGREAPAGDTLSAQLIAYYQPAGATQAPAAEVATSAAPAVDGKLAGTWTATPAKDAKIALAIQDDGKFNWDASGPGKPPTAIAGTSTLADGVLTLAAKGGSGRRPGRKGGLAGRRPLHFPTRRRPADRPGAEVRRASSKRQVDPDE